MHSDELAQHQARTGTRAHWLIWLSARNLLTDQIETFGLWTGDDDAVFTIDGVSRLYKGAGMVFEIDPIREEIGLVARTQRIQLTTRPDQGGAVDLVRNYDPSQRPAQLHLVVLNPDTMQPVAPPRLRFGGKLDDYTIERGAVGAGSRIEIILGGPGREGTRTLPLKKSKADLQARAPGDGFRNYVGVVEDWTVPWGQRSQSASSGGGAAPSDPRGGAVR